MSNHTTCPVYICGHCNYHFSHRSSLERHLQNCGREQTLYVCRFCQKAFNRKDNLHQHVKTCKQKVVYCRQCPRCFKQFSNETDYQNHPCTDSSSNNVPAFTCPTCYKSFHTTKGLQMHKNRTAHNMIGRGKAKKQKSNPVTVAGCVAPSDTSPVSNTSTQSSQSQNHSRPCSTEALKGDVREYDFEGQHATDPLEYLVSEQNNVISTLETELAEKKSIKWALCLHIKMEKPSEEVATQFHEAYFRSEMQIATRGSDLLEQYIQCINKMLQSLDDYEGVHSGLNVSVIVLFAKILF